MVFEPYRTPTPRSALENVGRNGLCLGLNGFYIPFSTATKNTIQAALERHQEYLKNPPADYTTERVSMITFRDGIPAGMSRPSFPPKGCQPNDLFTLKPAVSQIYDQLNARRAHSPTRIWHDATACRFIRWCEFHLFPYGNDDFSRANRCFRSRRLFFAIHL